MVPGQFGFGVKQIDVAGATIHEEKDHRTGTSREMVLSSINLRRTDCSSLVGEEGTGMQQTIEIQQVRQRQPSESSASIPQQFAARNAA
jgi:hypothetical protein